MDSKQFKKLFLIKTNNDKTLFNTWIKSLGLDKCQEIYNNYALLTDKTFNIRVRNIIDFTLYEYSLSELLYSILRIQEDCVKAFLANLNYGKVLNIESKPSNFSKTKYYFLFPYEKEFLRIRTFNYTEGPVNYYDALKTLDFGDVNLIFFHLSKEQQQMFSNNENILDELDYTRKLRNYVYHHNILFSLGIERLKKSIILLLKNLPSERHKKYYINQINSLPFDPSTKIRLLNKNLVIHLDANDRKEINSIKPKLLIRY
ncbi:MAG: hypothetical protein MJ227_04325 [Bacilli bacterium]|nr:hypothetical protein [Bacilli bacterium]